MFTGLIEGLGTVTKITPATPEQMHRITIEGSCLQNESKVGDSIAVDGCCLTISSIDSAHYSFDCSAETLQVTNLGSLYQGQRVNLERALQFGDRLGGHLVSGHVDCTAIIDSIQKKLTGWIVTIKINKAISWPYLVKKGSICINGVSLTINNLEDDGENLFVFLTLIPKTIEITNWQYLSSKNMVNIEFDMIAKHLSHLAGPYLKRLG